MPGSCGIDRGVEEVCSLTTAEYTTFTNAMTAVNYKHERYTRA